MGFPGGSDVNESACNAGDSSSISGLVSSPGEGNGNPLQYSFLENSMDRGAWQATVHGVANSQTEVNNEHFHFQIRCVNGPRLERTVLSLEHSPGFFSIWMSHKKLAHEKNIQHKVYTKKY